MSKTEQDNLEHTLAILSNKLLQVKAQYKRSKQTVHTKQAFLLSSRTLLQNDLRHVFTLNPQLVKKRQRRRLEILPPPGLLPLLSYKGTTHNTPATTMTLPLEATLCTASLQQDRIWVRMMIENHGSERILQSHIKWMAPTFWTPYEWNQASLHTIPPAPFSSSSSPPSSSTSSPLPLSSSSPSPSPSPYSKILYAATDIPRHLLLATDQLVNKEFKATCRYMLENGEWRESPAITIQWLTNNIADHHLHWMKSDIENINGWAPVLYPYRVHLTSTSPLQSLVQDWNHLDDHVLITPDHSLLIVIGHRSFSPIHAHLYGINRHTMASCLYTLATSGSVQTLPWDGLAMDTRQRLQKTILSLIDQSSNPSLSNRENTVVQLSTLITSTASPTLE